MAQAIEADLTGRVAVVTGATSGIGKEIARALLGMGATVVIPARDVSRGAAVVGEIAPTGTRGKAVVLELDVSRPGSVRAFARAVRGQFPAVHILVNNAGMWIGERTETPDHREVIWATNVLGPYLLTRELEDALAAGAPSRVVNVSSVAAGRLDLTDPEYTTHKFSGFSSYMASKQALRMLTWTFADRLGPRGVTVTAVSPGFVRTSLNNGVSGFAAAFTRFAGKIMGQTPAQGADTPLWLAASAETAGANNKFFKEKRKEVPCTFRDPGQRARLWDLCESQTKE